MSQRGKIADVVAMIGIYEVNYYRWRKEYGGMKVTQVKRLRELKVGRWSRVEQSTSQVLTL